MSFAEKLAFAYLLVTDWRSKKLTAEKTMPLMEMLTKEPSSTMQGMEKARALAIISK